MNGFASAEAGLQSPRPEALAAGEVCELAPLGLYLRALAALELRVSSGAFVLAGHQPLEDDG